MLPADEIGRRLRAARELRGLSQVELGALFEADGLDKQAAARIERGEIPMRRSHREAFLHHLRVPARWLLADTVDEIVGLGEEPESVQATILAKLDTLAASNGILTDVERELLREFAEILNRAGRDVGRGRPRRRSGQQTPPASDEPAQ